MSFAKIFQVCVFFFPPKQCTKHKFSLSVRAHWRIFFLGLWFWCQLETPRSSNHLDFPLFYLPEVSWLCILHRGLRSIWPNFHGGRKVCICLDSLSCSEIVQRFPCHLLRRPSFLQGDAPASLSKRSWPRVEGGSQCADIALRSLLVTALWLRSSSVWWLFWGFSLPV